MFENTDNIRMPRVKQNKGIIFDIIRYAIHDGPGIRTTVFLKGCPLACWWCQNPESQKSEPEKVNAIDRRKYSNLFYGEDANIIGREVTIAQVMAEVDKDRIFYEYSGGGVTFSGGEPLMQPDFLLGLLMAGKKKGLRTALDTSGHASWASVRRIMKYVDLFLYDLKIMDERVHQKYTGEGNELILDNLKRLVRNKANIIVRIPVITGITDKKDNIRQIGEFVHEIKGIEQMHLLPYNYLCKDKYQRMKREYAMQHIKPTSDRSLLKIKASLETYGLHVKIEG
jgi:pyruvate formate lyase activating enzyme